MHVHRYITENLWLKVFSLVLATLVWYVIHSNFQGTSARTVTNPFQPQTDKNFVRPIVLMTSANNRQAFQVDPTEVTVKVLGEPSILQKLRPEDIQVYVKLLDVQNPQGSFRVEVTAPREITIQQVWPAHVMVKPGNTGGIE